MCHNGENAEKSQKGIFFSSSLKNLHGRPRLIQDLQYSYIHSVAAALAFVHGVRCAEPGRRAVLVIFEEKNDCMRFQQYIY